jgi:hypothetical protein
MIWTTFLSGATMMACLVASGFFLRFWRQTSDRLFIIFSVAFFLLAIERLALTLTHGHEFAPFVYLIRLAAYTTLLIAIYDKNQS